MKSLVHGGSTYSVVLLHFRRSRPVPLISWADLVTCGIVLAIGESTDAGKGVFNQDDIGLAWKGCIETLTYMSKRHIRARDYLRLLQTLRQRARADRACMFFISELEWIQLKSRLTLPV